MSAIYIVDDDAGVRDSLHRWFVSNKFDVKSFATAADFLNAYQGELPGCAIIDIGMAPVSGFDLAREMTEKGIALPIIFITGESRSGLEAMAKDAGAVAIFYKPFDQNALLASVKQALALSGPVTDSD